MITNHDAAVIAELDAKKLTLTETVRSEEYVWPNGPHNGPARKYAELVETSSIKEEHIEDAGSFVKKNTYQYYVCINTWLYVIRAHNPIGADIVEDRIRANGFLDTIRSATRAALSIIGGESPEALWATVVRGMSVEDALQCLRFAKRFTVFSKTLAKQRVHDFCDNNNRMRKLNQSLDDGYIIGLVREEFHKLVRAYETPDTFARFTPGISAECGSALREKIAQYPDWNFGSVTLPNVGASGTYASISEFRAVPKDYKSYRGIAAEPVMRQSMQQGIRRSLEHSLDIVAGRYADIHDQNVNGTLSSNSDMATIDSSNASDSISIRLMSLLTNRVGCQKNAACDTLYRDLMAARSTHMHIDGKTVKLCMISSMGNGYTFCLETDVFLSIVRAGVNAFARYTGRPELHNQAWVYGDDVIVPADAYATVVDFLEACGIVVNSDKSYNTGSFRESCGFDWYEEQYVSSTYWPRASIIDSIESMPHLVSLQNRLAERGSLYYYWDAVRFLAKQVRRIAPNIGDVTVDELVEYSLAGRCLIGPVSSVMRKAYSREYSLTPGDGLTYSEERQYVNALVPKIVKHDIKRYQRNTMEAMNMQMYLYACHLHDGPFMIDHDASIGVEITGSQWERISREADGFHVTRIRLF